MTFQAVCRRFPVARTKLNSLRERLCAGAPIPMTSALSVLLVALLGLYISSHEQTCALPCIEIAAAYDHSSFLILSLAPQETSVFTSINTNAVIFYITASNAYDPLYLEHSVRAPPIA